MHQKGDVALDAIVSRLSDIYGTPDEVQFEHIYHIANRLMHGASYVGIGSAARTSDQ